MKKGIILYQSKYGATEKYAQWLTEMTGFACVETKKANIAEVKEYDTVVLGGGIYASGIAGISFLRKNREQLQGKKIAVFCVGASPYDEKVIQEIIAQNFKEDLKDIPCFYCRGAWNESAMSFVDRKLCGMLVKSLKKQDPSTYEPWQAALAEAVGQTCDWTDQKYLEPLVTYLAN